MSMSPEERYLLARRLLGAPGTAEQAFELALLGAEAGHAKSATLVGDAYRWGLGTEPNEEESLKGYERSGELGDGAGYAGLGARHVDSMGKISDPMTAKVWFEKAIALGYMP